MSDQNTQNGDHGVEADRLLSWPQVQAVTGLSRTTAWRRQRVGDFPTAVLVSPGRVAWLESEVRAWRDRRRPRSAGTLPSNPPNLGRAFSPVSSTTRPAAQSVSDESPTPIVRARKRPPVCEGQLGFGF